MALKQTLGQNNYNDNSIRCFPMPLLYMSAAELNDSISLFVFEVKNEDASEYSANSVHGLACFIQPYRNTGYCVRLKMHVYNKCVIKI